MYGPKGANLPGRVQHDSKPYVASSRGAQDWRRAAESLKTEQKHCGRCAAIYDSKREFGHGFGTVESTLAD